MRALACFTVSLSVSTAKRHQRQVLISNKCHPALLVDLGGDRIITIGRPAVAIMATHRIRFRPGLSMPESLKDYGSEEQCEQALESLRRNPGSWVLNGM